MYLNWNNIITTPNRMMAWYLKRQGWVCFYLEPEHRRCGPVLRRLYPGTPTWYNACCYLDLYQQEEKPKCP